MEENNYVTKNTPDKTELFDLDSQQCWKEPL